MRPTRLQRVVMAIEALHFPIPDRVRGKILYCAHCRAPRSMMRWPCPTITEVRNALNGLEDKL